MTDITELAQAAEKYRLTLEAHRQNPRNYDALDAWDKASSEFMALVNNDELNIISSLLDKLETEEGYRKGAFLACNRWHNKFRQTEDKLETEERRNAELVEALEKAKTINAAAEKLVRCKGRYHSEQNYRALAALFGVTTPDLPPLDSESRTVTVKLPKPHAHLIWIQAGHAPDDYWDDVAVSHSEKDRCCDGSERYPVYARWEIEEMLAAAGIKWEAE